MMKCIITQLPFPSQTDPFPVLQRYYRSYAEYYARLVPGYRVRDGDLWEAPLWVAHLDAAIGRPDTIFEDLSLAAFDVDACCRRLAAAASKPTLFLFSPLAQNFDLAMDVSERLMALGHATTLGGNMVGLERPGSFSFVFRGQARRGFLDALGAGQSGTLDKRGRRAADFGYRPDYRLLRSYRDRVSLLRINASHGCLFACSFCGDAWSHQLHVVPADDLAREFDELSEFFPGINLFYVGDKTFGQSSEAVKNLIAARPRSGCEFIVQTHVQAMSDGLIDQMEELGVTVVELGFESADPQVLRQVNKRNDVERYLAWMEKLDARGMHVILNLLGGLPYATEGSHRATVAFLQHARRHAKLYNLYNFVPYPKTPIFPTLRPRILDWNFCNWREDRPVIFTPFHQSASELWEQFVDLVDTCDSLVRVRMEQEKRMEYAEVRV